MIPPYYPQETDFSCAVACLRMVLAAYGVSKSEAELRGLCDCTIFGTTALELIRVARGLGFTATRKYSLTLEDLRDFTVQGYFPIIYGAMAGDVSGACDQHAGTVQRAVANWWGIDQLATARRTVPLASHRSHPIENRYKNKKTNASRDCSIDAS